MPGNTERGSIFFKKKWPQSHPMSRHVPGTLASRLNLIWVPNLVTTCFKTLLQKYCHSYNYDDFVSGAVHVVFAVWPLSMDVK